MDAGKGKDALVYEFTPEYRRDLLGGDEVRPPPGGSPVERPPDEHDGLIDYETIGGVLHLNAAYPRRHADGLPVVPPSEKAHQCRQCQKGYTDNALRVAMGYRPGICAECHDDGWTIRGMEFAAEIGDRASRNRPEHDMQVAHQKGWRQTRVDKIDHDCRARYEQHMQNKAIREWMAAQAAENS